MYSRIDVTPAVHNAVGSVIDNTDANLALIDAMANAVATGATVHIEDPYRRSRRIIVRNDAMATAPWAHIRVSCATGRVISAQISMADPAKPGWATSSTCRRAEDVTGALRAHFVSAD